MATTSYGTPYVQSSDLVSGWPNASLNVANRIDQVSYAGNGINAQTVTSYTLAVTDAGKLVTLNNAAAVAVNLPQDSTANLPVGSVTRIYNLGAGVVTVQAGSGATLQGGSVTVAQYDACDVTKLSANTYGIAAKAPSASPTFTGTVNFSGATVTGLTTGLTFIATQSFSAASSASVNSCFSATYDAYRIVMSATCSVSDQSFRLRYRAAGTDATGANYNTNRFYAQGTSVGGTNSASQTSISLGNVTGPSTLTTVDIVAPALAEPTQSFSNNTYGSNPYVEIHSGYHTLSTAYDGFTIFPASGTVTGTVRVYGYKN